MKPKLENEEGKQASEQKSDQKQKKQADKIKK